MSKSVPGLAVVDLRDVEEADTVAAAALRRALKRLPRVAVLVPPLYWPARAVLEDELRALHRYDRPADLAAGEGVELPCRPGRDRRRHPRVSLRLPVEVRVDEERRRSGWTVDLSEGGARVDTPDRDGATEMRELLELAGRTVLLALAGELLRARVARVDTAPLASLGLQFLHPDAHARERLSELVAGAA